MGEGINYIVSWSMAIIMFIGIAYIFKGVGKIKQTEDTNDNNDQTKKSQYKYYAKPYVMILRENSGGIFSWCETAKYCGLLAKIIIRSDHEIYNHD